MTDLGIPKVTFVVQFSTRYASLADAMRDAPEQIAAHRARSSEFHQRGELLMAGAFLDNQDETLSAMAVLTSRQAAEEYAHGDPLVVNGMVSEWRIREWGNLLA